MTERAYYAWRIRWNAADMCVVWYQDERDGFVRISDGRLLTAKSIADLSTANLGSTLVSDEPIYFDFDSLNDWCTQPTVEGLNCQKFLDAWNFFDDLCGLHTNPESKYAQLSRSEADMYDKLFWGNNLPSMTPVGERFVPSWTEDELMRISQVFKYGVQQFEKELAPR